MQRDFGVFRSYSADPATCWLRVIHTGKKCGSRSLAERVRHILPPLGKFTPPIALLLSPLPPYLGKAVVNNLLILWGYWIIHVYLFCKSKFLYFSGNKPQVYAFVLMLPTEQLPACVFFSCTGHARSSWWLEGTAEETFSTPVCNIQLTLSRKLSIQTWPCVCWSRR